METIYTDQFKTQTGVLIKTQTRSLEVAHALDEVYSAIDQSKGGLLVSNYETPDRYPLWDIGFVHPALELVCRQRHFTIQALNQNGRYLLSLIHPHLKQNPHLEALDVAGDVLQGTVLPMPAFFSEEERSKQPSIFSVIRSLLELFKSSDPYLGLYGAFGYDLVSQFEPLYLRHPRSEDQVDCHLFLPTELFLVDRQKQVAFKVSYHIQTPAGITNEAFNGGSHYPFSKGTADSVLTCDHQPGEFEKKVEEIRSRCQQGDFFEVVLSQSFQTGFNSTPLTLFRRICDVNPSPYSFLLNFGKECLVGASPEMYVRVTGDRFETCPISGTIAVGKDPMETAENIKTLMSSQKDETELAMCTDVDRNDMSRVCLPGSVKLLGRRLIEKYSRLIHTVDHLEGRLAPHFDSIDALLCHMWACTVTGSPKPIAMQTIEDLENSPRGWYSGAVGFLCFNGNLNTGMTLRTVHLKEGLATIRAGATLLYDSDPRAEEEETRVKASAFLDAVLQPVDPVIVKKIPTLQKSSHKQVLLVDHQDSFVHTLANYIRQTGAHVTTLRAGFPLEELDRNRPDLVVLSPGPLTPSDQKVPQLVQALVERGLSIFGVCLGHQGIAESFGGSLKVFDRPWHGKASEIYHQNEGIFKGLPSPFTAGRYHSLYVDRETLPDCLEITALTEDQVIMGLRHRSLPIASVQFHPESILTLKNEAGILLIQQVLRIL